MSCSFSRTHARTHAHTHTHSYFLQTTNLSLPSTLPVHTFIPQSPYSPLCLLFSLPSLGRDGQHLDLQTSVDTNQRLSEYYDNIIRCSPLVITLSLIPPRDITIVSWRQRRSQLNYPPRHTALYTRAMINKIPLAYEQYEIVVQFS